MKIAVIGAGAMGSIYGSRLSLHHDVSMVDSSPAVVAHIQKEGIKLLEDGKEHIYRPKAVLSAEGMAAVSLVILFVKSLNSKMALSANRNLIGSHTYVMTLQNGAGHEDVLKEFVSEGRMIIGTTEDHGTVFNMGYVRRGGKGITNVGMLTKDKEQFLKRLKEAFACCGFPVKIHSDIRQLIWNKLFINASLSAVTGILQADMGYVTADGHAWNMAVRLIKEASAVARALGLHADNEEIMESVKEASMASPKGSTSIQVDLKNGRKTEVDAISGFIVKAAKKCGVPVPSHEFVVEMIHAMETRKTTA